MIIDMKEVNEDNISDWSAETLRDMQKRFPIRLKTILGIKPKNCCFYD